MFLALVASLYYMNVLRCIEDKSSLYEIYGDVRYCEVCRVCTIRNNKCSEHEIASSFVAFFASTVPFIHKLK